MVLKCDPKDRKGTTSKVDEITGQSGKYEVTLSVCNACPADQNPCKRGLSFGSILLIIGFVGMTVYCAAGVLINRFYRQKQGVEQIPNSGKPPPQAAACRCAPLILSSSMCRVLEKLARACQGRVQLHLQHCHGPRRFQELRPDLAWRLARRFLPSPLSTTAGYTQLVLVLPKEELAGHLLCARWFCLFFHFF